MTAIGGPTPLSYSPRFLVALLLASSIPLISGVSACDRPPASAPGGAAIRSRDSRLLLEALEQAPTHGFRRGAFGEIGLAERLKRGDPSASADLRRAVIAYARALRGHAIAAKAFDPDWGLKPRPYDAAAGFDAALAQGQVAAWLQGLPPQTPRYQALRAGYLAYSRTLAAGGWRPISDGPALKAGASGERVAELRTRLAVEDPALAASIQPPASDQAAAADAAFDEGLVQAVKRAQARYGLEPTGVADPALLAELNVPVEGRLAQIRASL